MISPQPKIIFWGSDEFSITVLEELLTNNLKPTLIITTPDSPQGRKLTLTPSPVKIWAEKNSVTYIAPDRLKHLTTEETNILTLNYDIALVASYGKIIPEALLNIPRLKTLNIHPSLLPQYRGPTPIQTTILNGDQETGVTLMLVDNLMDHGPIIAQVNLELHQNETNQSLRHSLAILGARLFITNLPTILNQEITPQTQVEDHATYTKKITKNDGEIDLEKDQPKKLAQKWRALNPWPGLFFFYTKNGTKQRIKISEASFTDDKFNIIKIIPEGKKETTWSNFQSSKN